MKQLSTLARGDEAIERIVAQVADEFLDRLQNGNEPNLEEFVERHPEAASEIRQALGVLKTMQVMDDWALGDELGPDSNASKVIGDFRLLRVVGRGGMGVVYEAEQISLNRRVALKILPSVAALDATQLRRFKNESMAAASLDHPHIVQVYGVGCDNGIHHYSMKFIDGRTIADVIEDLRESEIDVAPGLGKPTLTGSSRAPKGRGRSASSQSGARSLTQETLSLVTTADVTSQAYFRAVARIGKDIAEALDYAHKNGVLHRDIKPANILVDRDAAVYVTDFGLARIETNQTFTASGDMLGTLRYMSPEQMEGNRARVDYRSDIYSFGAMLYELLTLTPATPGKDRQEILSQIAIREPVSPKSLNPSIPTDLSTIVLKALAKAPEERFQTARDIVDELDRFLNDQPIVSIPPSWFQRAKKWLRRHPIHSAAATLILLVSTLALVAVVSIMGLSQATIVRERDLSEAQKERAERVLTLAMHGFTEEDFAQFNVGLAGAADQRQRSSIQRQVHVAAIQELHRRIASHPPSRSQDRKEGESELVRKSQYLAPYSSGMELAISYATFALWCAENGSPEEAILNLEAAVYWSDLAFLNHRAQAITTLRGRLQMWRNGQLVQSQYQNIRETFNKPLCDYWEAQHNPSRSIHYCRPVGMIIDKDERLYFSGRNTNSIFCLDVSTGNTVREVVPDVDSPSGLAITENGLVIVGQDCGKVSAYDLGSGKFVRILATGTPGFPGIIADQRGYIYASSYNSDSVHCIDPSGEAQSREFVASGAGGLDAPVGIAFGPDGNLYVASVGLAAVNRYDGVTGDFIDRFASGNGLLWPTYLAFGPDGDLYVCGRESHAVHRFDGKTGEARQVYIAPELVYPECVAFAQDGTFFVNNTVTAEILRIDPKTGEVVQKINSPFENRSLEYPASIRSD